MQQYETPFHSTTGGSRPVAYFYADAMFMLGTMYETGEGVEKDAERAANWYERAAALGNRDALARLKQVRQ